MSTKRKKIVAISGSTRINSTNHNLINAIIDLSANYFDITLYQGIAALPHFNPDENKVEVAPEVATFRRLLNEADAVIICTPEYAHGVPGSLKNAIDWTVSTNEFSQKPTMLITASTDGYFGHQSLLETLRVIEAKHLDELQLLIQFAKTKIRGNEITDKITFEAIKLLLEKLNSLLL